MRQLVLSASPIPTSSRFAVPNHGVETPKSSGVGVTPVILEKSRIRWVYMSGVLGHRVHSLARCCIWLWACKSHTCYWFRRTWIIDFSRILSLLRTFTPFSLAVDLTALFNPQENLISNHNARSDNTIPHKKNIRNALYSYGNTVDLLGDWRNGTKREITKDEKRVGFGFSTIYALQPMHGSRYVRR